VFEQVFSIFFLVGEHVELIKSSDPVSLILSELSIRSRNK
jgi:hypothetical protein